VLANAAHAEALVGSRAELAAPLHAIQLAGKQAAALSKSLLAYIGQAPTVAEATDLSALVVDIVALGRAVVPKQIELRTEAPMGRVDVVCDRSQLSQLVMNLLNNAAEAIGDVKGVVTVTTDVVELARARDERAREREAERWMGTPPDRGRYARLRVTDTGQGMSAEVRARIFDPFFSTKAPGRGLGLAAVLGIVRTHGGAIALDTERGRGSTFEVLFPPGSATSRRRQPAPSPQPDRAGAVLTKPVLFVDDEWILRETGRQILEDAGFQVMVAADGVQAMALFDADPDRFAAVLVDLTMPGPSGDVVIARMRDRRPQLPVVRMSGYRAPDDASACRGCVFVEKPYEASELAEAVRRALTTTP